MRVAVVGLGLIGGSVALALRRSAPNVCVIGVERAAQVAAVPNGLVDRLIVAEGRREVEAALGGVDLAVLCAPVRVIGDLVGSALRAAEVVTDCGSTKRAVAASAAGSERHAWFVPGHPMAGAPEGGVERARADLFDGRRWIVCPEGRAPEAVARTEQLVRGVGGEIVHMSVEDHDRAVAVTSHLPQVLASALVVLAEQREAERAVGPGFQSSTRVAGGPESMWLDIFLTNGDEVARAMVELRAMLEQIEAGLTRAPAEAGPALELLRRARRVRDG